LQKDPQPACNPNRKQKPKQAILSAVQAVGAAIGATILLHAVRMYFVLFGVVGKKL